MIRHHTLPTMYPHMLYLRWSWRCHGTVMPKGSKGAENRRGYFSPFPKQRQKCILRPVIMATGEGKY